ncbi:MAG: DUF4294 domain-containing protein [Flavobacteriales bacterium]|nr:DUF4294 domain-containing protein [Flavobacteriales bacterium]
MKAYILVISCLISLVGYSQSNNEQVILISENEQDSISDYIFPEIEISTDNDAYLKKYRKTKYFVRRVYAYSKLASNMLLSFQDTLEYIDSKRMKKRYLNRANKILKNEFGDEIKNMSVTRGEYLMKLIYRETGLTTYDIIKFYRGKGKAFWFQALCKINGQDLKREYDPLKEDFLIEKVVNEIEKGQLSYINRPAKTKAGKKSRRKRGEKKKKQKDLK